MKRIVLQAGHLNYKKHTIPALRRGGGAPGEIELTERIRNAACLLLEKRGFWVKKTDAVAYQDKEITQKDWDLFLAIHGDADIYGTGGGFIDTPDPSTDGAAQESQRIKLAIESKYFLHSGIKNHPERANKNTKYYYMWKFLTYKTPCVIIELGVVQDAHDKVILADTQRVAGALARGICYAFGVSYDQSLSGDEQRALEVLRETKEKFGFGNLEAAARAGHGAILDLEAFKKTNKVQEDLINQLEKEKNVAVKKLADYEKYVAKLEEEMGQQYDELKKQLDTCKNKKFTHPLAKLLYEVALLVQKRK